MAEDCRQRSKALCALWLAGASALLLWYLTGYALLRRKIRKNSAEIACPELRQYTDKKVLVLSCDIANVPFMAGVFCSVLILPKRAFTKEQFHNILRHETTHLKRRDILYKWFATLVKCVHWFNPVVWYAVRQIGTECEISCDLSVVAEMTGEEEIGYVDTILSMLSVRNTKAIPLTTGMAGSKKIIKRRLEMIRNKMNIGKRTCIVATALAVVMTASAVLAGGVLADEVLGGDIENQITGGAPANIEQGTPSETGATESTKKEIVTPTREEVYAAREQALKGMTEEQIDDLTEFVKCANLWLEYNYMYDNFFELLKNPDYPIWNYFHQTGEIQIGWAYDGNLDIGKICKSEGLSENEFYAKYGTPVCKTNTYDADSFAAAIASLKSNVQNEDLNNILQYVADESLLAKDTHDVVHVKYIYHTLHDLDYFLLRYGVEDVGPYVTDTSTIEKFYGTLPCYK